MFTLNRGCQDGMEVRVSKREIFERELFNCDIIKNKGRKLDTELKSIYHSAMNKYMILFAIGKDRPGIVDEVTSYLFKKHANIEDSRMAVLGGRFTIMCLFSCSSEELESIRAGLNSLNDPGLETSFHEADNPGSLRTEACLPLNLEVISMDHPGIVQSVVHILKKHNVSIQSLDTEIKAMPHTGAPMFDLNLSATVPGSQSISKVKDELNDMASEMNLDLIFRS